MADNVTLPGTGAVVGTDERSIAATNVQVQRVNEQAGTAYATGHVQISSTAATLVAARETRKTVTVINRQTVPIYVGPATVTTSTGILLNTGDSYTFRTTALIQAITSAAYTASGEDTKVHYEESYDS